MVPCFALKRLKTYIEDRRQHRYQLAFGRQHKPEILIALDISKPTSIEQAITLKMGKQRIESCLWGHCKKTKHRTLA